MIESDFNEIMALLDNLWGGLDEGLEAGYRWALEWEDDPKDVYELAARELVDGIGRRPQDTPFLPKAPEFKQRVDAIKRMRATEERMRRLAQRQLGPTLQDLIGLTNGGNVVAGTGGSE